MARQPTGADDKLAVKEVPALGRVKALAVAVAIEKNLKAAGVHIDLARIATILNHDHTPTIGKISPFSVGYQREERTPFYECNREGECIRQLNLQLFGGVDLSSVHPVQVSDDGSAKSMANAATSAFRARSPVRGSFISSTTTPVLSPSCFRC
jgi:hypothetical protein